MHIKIHTRGLRLRPGARQSMEAYLRRALTSQRIRVTAVALFAERAKIASGHARYDVRLLVRAAGLGEVTLHTMAPALSASIRQATRRMRGMLRERLKRRRKSRRTPARLA